MGLRPDIIAGIVGTLSAPVNSVAPSITGTFTLGQAKTYVPGTWSGNPTIVPTLLANGAAVPGAITGTVIDDTGQGGKALSIGETATNAAGSNAAVSVVSKYLFTKDEARLFVARIVVEPANYVKSAYDVTYATPNFASALSAIDAITLSAGPDKQAALLYLNRNSSLIEVGALTHVPGLGLSTGGALGSVDFGFNQNAGTQMTLNSASLIAGISTGTNTGNNWIISCASGFTDFYLITNDTAQSSCRVNDATNLGHANNGPTGLFIAQRTGVNASDLRQDGVSLATDTVAAVTLTNSPIIGFRSSSSGSWTDAGTVVDMFGVGGKLTTTQETALINARSTFRTLMTPNLILVIGAGQSLESLLQLDGTNPVGVSGRLGSGDGTVGSNAQTRVLVPELQTYIDAQFNTGKPNIITYLNTAVGGTPLIPHLPDLPDSWWDLSSGGVPGYYAINDRALVAQAKTALLNATGRTFDHIIRIWKQGEAEASYAGQGSNYVTGCTGGAGASYATGLFKYFRDGDGGATPIIITPLGQRGVYPDADLKQVRDAQTTIAANCAGVTLGPDTCDTIRASSDDWHPVSTNVSVLGFDRQCHWDARTLAHVLGCTAVTYRGPEFPTATRVSDTQTDVAVSYPSGCAGTDFTPTTGILGAFNAFSSGVSKAISAGVRTSAINIRFTHAVIPIGTGTIQYVPGQGSADRTLLVCDNYGGLPNGMPARMSALLTIA